MAATNNSVSGTMISDIIGDYKQYYAGVDLMNEMLKAGPLLSLINQEMDISGQGGNSGNTSPVYPSTSQGGYPVPVMFGGGASPSQQLANAIANSAAPRVVQFQAPIVSTFQTATVNRVAQLASRNGAGAFMTAMDLALDSAFQAISNYTAAALYRNTNGVFGVINNGGVSSQGVVQLTQPTDAINFQVDTCVNAGTISNGVVSLVGGSTPTQAWVGSLDKSLGTLTLVTTQGGSTPSTAFSAGQSLFFDGVVNASTGIGQMIAGVSTWNPDLAYLRPASGQSQQVNSLFGVDRSVDPLALAGQALQVSGESIEDGLIDLVSEIARAGGGEPSHCFMNPVSFRALTKELRSRGRYSLDEETGPTGIKVLGITLMADSGPVKIIADRWAPPKRAYCLELKSWKLIGYSKFPGFLEYADGLDWLRTANGDAVQCRLGGDIQCVNMQPAHSGIGILPY